MRIAIDSDDFPSAKRRDSWRGLLCDTYMGIDCRLPEDFRSVIEGNAVGEHTLTRITSSHHTVERSPTLIKRDELELILFGIPLAGRAVTLQGGREVVLERGSLVVTDSSRPFVTHVGSAAEIIWLSVPKKPVAERIRGIEDLVAISLRPDSPVEQIAIDFMAGIDEVAERGLDAGGEQLMTQVLDLLARTIMCDARWPQRSWHAMPRWPIH